MIGRITGILLEKISPYLLIDVNGVAYELEVPLSTFYALPEMGQGVTLHTHLVVREDAQLLFGFYQQRERALFRNLIKVSSVGPKLALAILSGIDVTVFVESIMQNDTANLVRIPGVGKKTAERLMIEMRDRLDDWKTEEMSANSKNNISSSDKASQDAISALIALGYKVPEAKYAVSQFSKENYSSEELIRNALRSMLKGGAYNAS